MSYTYTSNIPVSGQSLNVTKNPINQNFQAINQLIAVNHVGFNSLGLGKHNTCELVAQTFTGSQTAPTTLSGEDTIFSKTTGGVTDIFYTADAGGNAYQLTTSNDTNFVTFGTFTNYSPPVANQFGGWTMLPGGLIFQYGKMTTLSGGNTAVVFPFAFPTAIFSLTAFFKQTVSQEDTWGFINEGVAGFTFTTDGGSGHTFYWQAIGK